MSSNANTNNGLPNECATVENCDLTILYNDKLVQSHRYYTVYNSVILQ